MGGNPNPVPNQVAELPDPGEIEALAAQWLSEGATLSGLAALVPGVVQAIQWTGDAERAAVAAAAAVAQVIEQVATAVIQFGQALEQYAAAVRQALKEEEAFFVSSIIEIVLFAVTIPFFIVDALGDAFMAVVESIGAAISRLGLLGVNVSRFVSAALVNVSLGVGFDLGPQLIGDRAAGVPAKPAAPFLIPVDVLGGVLFGEPGAFQMVADAVAMAANNYGEAEDSNQKMFLSLVSSLGSSAPPGAPVRDQGSPPVTENAPAPP